MDETTGRLPVIAHLHQRSGEVEVGDVGRLPFGSLGGEAVANHQLRTTLFFEDRGVEAKPGADDHPVILEVSLDFVGAGKTDGDEIRVVLSLDFLHRSIQQRVLGLQLIGVEHVVVDCPQMPDEMSLPRQVKRARTDDVDHRRRFDQVVGGLESRVTLANDQNPLVDEVARLDRN